MVAVRHGSFRSPRNLFEGLNLGSLMSFRSIVTGFEYHAPPLRRMFALRQGGSRVQGMEQRRDPALAASALVGPCHNVLNWGVKRTNLWPMYAVIASPDGAVIVLVSSAGIPAGNPAGVSLGASFSLVVITI